MTLNIINFDDMVRRENDGVSWDTSGDARTTSMCLKNNYI